MIMKKYKERHFRQTIKKPVSNYLILLVKEQMQRHIHFDIEKSKAEVHKTVVT